MNTMDKLLPQIVLSYYFTFTIKYVCQTNKREQSILNFLSMGCFLFVKLNYITFNDVIYGFGKFGISMLKRYDFNSIMNTIADNKLQKK